MKLLFLFLTMVIMVAATAQKKLYYFAGKDNLVGVKDHTGKVIILAIHTEMTFYDFENPIEGNLIQLWLPKDENKYKNSFGVYYNRQGKLLCHPYNFDNGPDYLQEGFFRFVENNKIGFANRFGEKKIDAKYDFVAPFLMGTALFCKDCYFDKSKDEDHPPLVNGTFGFIDKKGNVLKDNITFSASVNFWDQLDSIRQQLYKTQFNYTPFEKKIVQKLNPYKTAISKKYFERQSIKGKKELEFHIVEKPFPGFPYYVINGFEKSDNNTHATDPFYLEFRVSADGKNMFHHDVFEGNIPFSKWFPKFLKKE